MKLFSKDNTISNKKEIIDLIRNSAVFVYPTDTIYGIGCDAKDSGAVKRLRDIKKSTKSMSVIAPSKDWIRKQFIMNNHILGWLDKLPGPYTFILQAELTLETNQIQDNVASGDEWIGVRIPDHWMSDIVNEAGVPIISTSANITTRDFMTHIDNLDKKIKEKIDFIIDEGEIDGTPSTIVDFHTHEPKIIKR